MYNQQALTILEIEKISIAQEQQQNDHALSRHNSMFFSLKHVFVNCGISKLHADICSGIFLRGPDRTQIPIILKKINLPVISLGEYCETDF